MLNVNPAVRPASQTLRTLEEAFSKLDIQLCETGSLGDTNRYSSLLRAASTSPYESTRAAAKDHLRRRGDFSPSMQMVDFIKKADRFGFETIGLFKSIVDGHVLVPARAADAQIMLANTKDQVVIEVELHRFFINDGSAPEFSAECFGEDHDGSFETVGQSRRDAIKRPWRDIFDLDRKRSHYIEVPELEAVLAGLTV